MRQKDQKLVCLDLQGNELWNSGRDKFGSGPYMIADGLIYVLDDDGLLTDGRGHAGGYQPAGPGTGDRRRRDQLGADGLGGRPADRPRFDAHGVPGRGREAGAVMDNERKLSWVGLLVGLVAAMVVAAGTFAISHIDPWADRNQGQSAAEIVPAVDPALIRYGQTAAWPTDFKEAHALAVGPDDQVYVGGYRAVRVFHPDGTAGREIALEGTPQCLVVAGRDHARPGRIYVGMEDHVEVYSAAGKRVAAWKSLGAKAFLTALAAAEEDVFAADAGNCIVWHYDTNGKLKGRIGDPDKARNYPGFLISGRYFPLTLGSDGLLDVVNPRALRVEVYTFTGDLERSWGKVLSGIEGFFGCCNPVYLATLPDGRFVTVEKGARRVKLYSAQGKFDCVVAGPEQLPAESGPVAADGRGRILVLDPAASVVRVFEAKKPSNGQAP